MKEVSRKLFSSEQASDGREAHSGRQSTPELCSRYLLHQDASGILKIRYPQDTAVSSGYRVLRIPRVSWDTVSPGYRPLSWGYAGPPRMPPVSQDAKPRLQTAHDDLEAHRVVQSERFGGQRLARVREEGAVRVQMHNVLRRLPRVLLLALLVGLAVVVSAPPHEVERLAVVGRRPRDDVDDPLVWLTILVIRVARRRAGGRQDP